MIVCGDRLNFTFCEDIAKKLDANIFYPEIVSFPDGELRVSIFNQLVGKDVLLIKQFGVKDLHSEIIKTGFIIDALRRAGAEKITGFLPYFPYVRSDHEEKRGEAVNLEVIARFFETSGLDALITIDPHTIKFPEFFTIPVHVLSAISLFAREIGRDIKNTPFSLVSPDSGGIRMIGPLSEIFHHASIVNISKDRFPDGSVEATDIEGKVEKVCVIVDDIIATGGTIKEGVKILKKNGASEFYIFATHAVLSKNSKNNLLDSAIKKIFVSNSLQYEKKEYPFITMLPTTELLITHLDQS